MSPHAILASAWTVLIALLFGIALVLLLGLIALIRRSQYASRAGRILLSMLICPAYFVPATLLIEKAYSHSAAYRVHVGDEGFAVMWDVVLLIGSTWLALVVGWFAARLLGGNAPIGWTKRSASIRDAGLLGLLGSTVVLLFVSTTGPELRSFEPLALNAWGMWGLGQALPMGRLLVRRLHTAPAAEGETGQGPRLDRIARPYLAGYYWFAAAGIPYAIWAFSYANQIFQD